MIQSIDDITNIFYINLEHRVDRKEYIEKELQNIFENPITRFNAINLKSGALGCSMSHLKCIENAKKK